MLIKFFHRGTATSDSAMAYLLSEAPLKYLTGARNRHGVVRNPAPAVIKGSPELTRKLINQCRNKHKYTSGVISFERLISKADEKKIIRRFEAAAFAGLRDHQFHCLWIRHSHLKRSELHFLAPRTELTTLKALNINPPRQRKEGLYDTFRKLTNHEFNLKDPSGRRLSRAEYDRLAQKLTKLVAARAAYNQSRYPVVAQQRIEILSPIQCPDRIGFADRGLATPRMQPPAARPAVRPTFEHLDRATRNLGQACQLLGIADRELGGAVGEIQGRLIQHQNRHNRVAISRDLFARYEIPQTQSAPDFHDRGQEELVLDRSDNL